MYNFINLLLDYIIQWNNTFNTCYIIYFIRLSQLSGFYPIKIVYLCDHYDLSGLHDLETDGRIGQSRFDFVLAGKKQQQPLVHSWSLNNIIVIVISREQRLRARESNWLWTLWCCGYKHPFQGPVAENEQIIKIGLHYYDWKKEKTLEAAIAQSDSNKVELHITFSNFKLVEFIVDNRRQWWCCAQRLLILGLADEFWVLLSSFHI